MGKQTIGNATEEQFQQIAMLESADQQARGIHRYSEIENGVAHGAACRRGHNDLGIKSELVADFPSCRLVVPVWLVVDAEHGDALGGG